MLTKIQEAVPRTNEFVLEHADFTESLDVNAVLQWREAVELWEQDASNPNPFERTVKSEFLQFGFEG